MPTEELKQQLLSVGSEGVVRGGKITGEYDFYRYVAALEGKTVRWTLELVPVLKNRCLKGAFKSSLLLRHDD